MKYSVFYQKFIHFKIFLLRVDGPHGFVKIVFMMIHDFQFICSIHTSLLLVFFHFPEDHPPVVVAAAGQDHDVAPEYREDADTQPVKVSVGIVHRRSYYS